MKHILVIDNRDSFVYNIVEYLRECGSVMLSVVRDDDNVDLAAINYREYDGVVLSPGAGLPSEYKLMTDFLNSEESKRMPVLGVCLGLQALVEHSGGVLKQLPSPKHGHSSPLIAENSHHYFLEYLEQNTPIARYHSWVVDEQKLPMEWDILARDEDDNIMIVAHKQYPWIATQFHPESIITKQGRQMIEAWVRNIEN